MDISAKEISILKPIFDGIRDKDEPYKIVWIPIVEHWTDDMQAKFEMLQSNMPWYILQPFPPTVDIQVMKNEYCSLKNKPIVVVINPQGEVEHPNALRMIRLFGMKAFPFTAEAKKAIMPEGLRLQFRANVSMKESGPRQDDKNYTFKCYGIANTLEAEFTHHLNIISRYLASNSDPDIRINMNLIEQSNSTGRVVLCKGTHGEIVVGDQGTKILNVLENFEQWKADVNDFGFDHSFMLCYRRL
ncbi:uncharacterized protein LOC118349882 [Juglans regia]|uniref:Uncharacterized protein LOC118349882 n=1 Tax=Juglans regia TaxID=51240 RepID=A0A6P9EWU8_JUGRE|nr:uncharacterized protein LOC118349882 [Juglans regia]